MDGRGRSAFTLTKRTCVNVQARVSQVSVDVIVSPDAGASHRRLLRTRPQRGPDGQVRRREPNPQHPDVSY